MRQHPRGQTHCQRNRKQQRFKQRAMKCDMHHDHAKHHDSLSSQSANCRSDAALDRTLFSGGRKFSLSAIEAKTSSGLWPRRQMLRCRCERWSPETPHLCAEAEGRVGALFRCAFRRERLSSEQRLTDKNHWPKKQAVGRNQTSRGEQHHIPWHHLRAGNLDTLAIAQDPRFGDHQRLELSIARPASNSRQVPIALLAATISSARQASTHSPASRDTPDANTSKSTSGLLICSNRSRNTDQLLRCLGVFLPTAQTALWLRFRVDLALTMQAQTVAGSGGQLPAFIYRPQHVCIVYLVARSARRTKRRRRCQKPEHFAGIGASFC